jgi:ferredoxin-nitrite reductase
MGGNPLAVRGELPGILERGFDALTPAEKELLKWLGVFFRKPTPGRFMMRIRMANGLATAEQFRAIAGLSSRLGNSVVDITTRQQIELRGFTLESIPEIWERLRGVELHSLQTGIDNVRNINGCPLAGLTPHELFDAAPVVREIDARIVGRSGNPEFANLPRKFNITVTGCRGNCTHAESQDIALVPAVAHGRNGFNVLVGGKMGSGGMTVASPLDVFVEPGEAAALVVELVKIYRDHGPRQARSRCRFAFLIEEWGIERLRAELARRVGGKLEPQGRDARLPVHADHLGVSMQKQPGLAAVGLCVPTGRVNPAQMQELARLAEHYGDSQIRLTTGQNVILPNIAAGRVTELLAEPLLAEFSAQPSPFFRGMVACVGTDYCNLALIETKQRAIDLSRALEARLGTAGRPLTIHWSGCPAGCGNHQAADIGFRGFKTKINGELVDAVAIYAGGKTGPGAVPGREIIEMVPCDEAFADRVARVVREYRRAQEQSLPAHSKHRTCVPRAERTAARGEGPAAASAAAGTD